MGSRIRQALRLALVASFAATTASCARSRPPNTPADVGVAPIAGAAELSSANGPIDPERPMSDSDHDSDAVAGTGSAADEHSDATPGEGLSETQAQAPPLEPSGAAVAAKYARLDRVACEAELVRRRVPFERVGEARGVLAPLRLTGPIAGVTFRSPLPASQRKKSLMEIYDCRLVLALDDFAKMLAKHDIVEVIHLSVYRPATAKALKGNQGRRHSGALAIDAAIFKTKDGQTMSVEKDFHGRIGAHPCPAPANASELRKIACEANDARLFNVLLTPDYNWAHRNHFHLEVTAGVKWTLVR